MASSRMLRANQTSRLLGSPDGDVFGGFYSVAVKERDNEEGYYDPNIFAFSFEAHGRCMTPQMFAVNEGLKTKARVTFWKDFPFGFVCFVVGCFGCFWLGNEKSDSWCSELSKAYEGIQDTTLTGKNGCGPFLQCYRLVAIQLE